MVNYGYGPESVGWKPERKNQLADDLQMLLRKYEREYRERGLDWPSPGPTVEVDGVYGGVRLRRLTWLGDSDINELCERADDIYNGVMGLGPHY